MSKKSLSIQHLNATNITDVMALQDKIIAGLNPDEQHFILHRTEADYMKSLTGKSSRMVGIFDNGKLIAQLIYGLPKNGKDRDMPEFRPDIANNKLVIFEAILVDPAYRGHGLMHKMLDYVEETALDKNRNHALIQIAVDNPASWMNALHYGMKITKVDLDPIDDAKVIYLEKNIQRNKSTSSATHISDIYHMHIGNNIHKKAPQLFKKMQYLSEQGYVGIAFDKKTLSLIWLKEDIVPTNRKPFYKDFVLYQQEQKFIHTR